MFRKSGLIKVLSIVLIVLLTVVLFGNIISLADDEEGKSLTITAGASNQNTANNATNNANNTNTADNKAANNVVNNTATNNNASVYNNTANKAANKTNLPYTGKSSITVVLVIALVGSAIYAYKKVSDYNM